MYSHNERGQVCAYQGKLNGLFDWNNIEGYFGGFLAAKIGDSWAEGVGESFGNFRAWLVGWILFLFSKQYKNIFKKLKLRVFR